jgi:TRAP-type C4-dicarboxylate transport system permease small subunit
MKDALERFLGTVFGLIFVALSLLVAVETVLRKLFNISLQGADELGGYALAVGATIAFSLALLGRSHIRVDVFHDRLPKGLQVLLNWLSVVMLAAFSGLVAWLAWFVILDSAEYKSVSQTPWATPLVYPQAAWVAGLTIFALVTAGYAVRASWLLIKGRTDVMNREFGPRSTKDDVDEELEDLRARSAGLASPQAGGTAAFGTERAS